jgi:hypothetical protein
MGTLRDFGGFARISEAGGVESGVVAKRVGAGWGVRENCSGVLSIVTRMMFLIARIVMTSGTARLVLFRTGIVTDMSCGVDPIGVSVVE